MYIIPFRDNLINGPVVILSDDNGAHAISLHTSPDRWGGLRSPAHLGLAFEPRDHLLHQDNNVLSVCTV